MNNVKDVIIAGNTFYEKLQEDKNGRYRSWEYCYKIFNNAYKSEKYDEDLLCLHLAFYLASWGMYRGSTFLLQKDYKVHKEIIKELFNEHYKKL